MNKTTILILFVILIIKPAASDGIFNVLTGTYIDSTSDLPEVNNLMPDMAWQASGNIRAWVDVIGYNAMVTSDGEDFIPGQPQDYAIVRYDVKDSLDCGKCSFECKVDSIVQKASTKTQDNLTVARLDVVMKWHRTTCTGSNGESDVFSTNAEPIGWNGDRTTYYKESATFYDFEKSPQKYTLLGDFPVIITEYNNTISPKVSITIPRQEGVIKTQIEYHNATAVHYYGIGVVDFTGKNVPFFNLTRTDYWKVEAPLYRIGNNIIINGTTLNYDELYVSISSPYETVYSHNYSIVRLDYSPEKTWNPVFFLLVGMVTIFGIGIKRFLRSI